MNLVSKQLTRFSICIMFVSSVVFADEPDELSLLRCFTQFSAAAVVLMIPVPMVVSWQENIMVVMHCYSETDVSNRLPSKGAMCNKMWAAAMISGPDTQYTLITKQKINKIGTNNLFSVNNVKSLKLNQFILMGPFTVAKIWLLAQFYLIILWILI